MLQTKYMIQLSYYTLPNTRYIFFFNLKVRKKLDARYGMLVARYSILVAYISENDKASIIYSILDVIYSLLDT